MVARPMSYVVLRVPETAVISILGYRVHFKRHCSNSKLLIKMLYKATEQSEGRAQTSGPPHLARPLLPLVGPSKSRNEKVAQRAWGSGKCQTMIFLGVAKDLLTRQPCHSADAGSQHPRVSLRTAQLLRKTPEVKRTSPVHDVWVQMYTFSF